MYVECDSSDLFLTPALGWDNYGVSETTYPDVLNAAEGDRLKYRQMQIAIEYLSNS